MRSQVILVLIVKWYYQWLFFLVVSLTLFIINIKSDYMIQHVLVELFVGTFVASGRLFPVTNDWISTLIANSYLVFVLD